MDPRWIACADCGGKGKTSVESRCRACGGTGSDDGGAIEPNARYSGHYAACRVCGGEGVVMRSSPCETCGGAGVVAPPAQDEREQGA